MPAKIRRSCASTWAYISIITTYTHETSTVSLPWARAAARTRRAGAPRWSAAWRGRGARPGEGGPRLAGAAARHCSKSMLAELLSKPPISIRAGIAYRAELLDVAVALYVTLASMKRPETVTCNYLAQIAFRPLGPRLRLRFFGGRGL